MAAYSPTVWSAHCLRHLKPQSWTASLGSLGPGGRLLVHDHVRIGSCPPPGCLVPWRCMSISSRFSQLICLSCCHAGTRPTAGARLPKRYLSPPARSHYAQCLSQFQKQHTAFHATGTSRTRLRSYEKGCSWCTARLAQVCGALRCSEPPGACVGIDTVQGTCAAFTVCWACRCDAAMVSLLLPTVHFVMDAMPL